MKTRSRGDVDKILLEFEVCLLEGDNRRITELGVGEVDLDACFKACMELDIPYIVYEQDNNFDDDPLKSTEISYKCLEKLVAANS